MPHYIRNHGIPPNFVIRHGQGRDRLRGRVEVDETYWGSEEENVRGRQTGNKALIVIAAQEDGNGIGRIRMRHIPDASAESLMPFIEEAIEPGSSVQTDGWLGYSPLPGKGYRQRITFLKGQKESASELLPRVRTWCPTVAEGVSVKRVHRRQSDVHAARVRARQTQ